MLFRSQNRSLCDFITLQPYNINIYIIIINTLSSYLATEPLLVYHKVNHALSGWTKPLCVGPCTHEAIAYIFKSIYLNFFFLKKRQLFEREDTYVSISKTVYI